MDYKRYVGAQIGIYNLKGEKVGKVSHLRNRELLYIVDRNGATQHFEKSKDATTQEPSASRQAEQP